MPERSRLLDVYGQFGNPEGDVGVRVECFGTETENSQVVFTRGVQVAREGVQIGDQLVNVTHEALRRFARDPREDILVRRVRSGPEVTEKEISESPEKRKGEILTMMCRSILYS